MKALRAPPGPRVGPGPDAQAASGPLPLPFVGKLRIFLRAIF